MGANQPLFSRKTQSRRLRLKILTGSPVKPVTSAFHDPMQIFTYHVVYKLDLSFCVLLEFFSVLEEKKMPTLHDFLDIFFATDYYTCI